MELHEGNNDVQKEIRKTVNFRQRNIEQTTRAIDPDDLVCLLLSLFIIRLYYNAFYAV